MKQKTTGIVIIVISLLLFIVLYWFTIELNSYLHSACIMPDGTCPHSGSLPPQSYIGFTIVLILFIYGIYLISSSREIEMKEILRKKEIEKIVKTLTDDERKVYETIKESNGLVFQRKLIKETGFTKVKITRILDSLEMKGLVERKRRGMSNVVVMR